MNVEVVHYDSMDKLVLSINGLYLIFGFGTGDTFNAMVHLRSAPPAREYELIIKRPQLNLVQFLLGTFTHPPVRIHVVDYWQHDFSSQLTVRFPTLGFARGLEPDTERMGLCDVWLHPHQYNQVVPLSQDSVRSLREYFQAVPPARPLESDAVVLFPTAGTNFTDYVPKWEHIVKRLRSLGCSRVYVNQSGVAEYGNENIEGAEPLKLSHEELIRSVYAAGASIKAIGVRSGVLDILRFSRLRALVLYQPVPKGIFETCRFGLLPHSMDIIETICLQDGSDRNDAEIDYYVNHFICSALAA